MRIRRRKWRSTFILLLGTIFAAFVWTSFRLHKQLSDHTQLVPRLENDLRDENVSRNYNQTKNQTTTNQNCSACLLVMDDNHILIEWLAYHSFALPLSRVILAVDPRSETSPNSVIRRWHGRMQIDQWNDSDFMTTVELEQAEHHVRKFFKAEILEQPNLIRHRARQRIFYYKCMKQLKAEGQGWVALIDTDEFLSINYPTTTKLGLDAPPIDQPGSLLSFLEKEVKRPGNNLTSACVQIPRLRFGAVESTQQEINRLVPYGLNASLFQTMRWRRHAAPRNLFHNKISKTIIDLRRVDWDLLSPVDSIHRPILGLCGHRRLYIQNKEQVFVIHHYLGSREQYFYRNDSRTGKERSESSFAVASKLDEMPTGNDDLRAWLQGFFREHGKTNALALLKGVGMLENVAT